MRQFCTPTGWDMPHCQCGCSYAEYQLQKVKQLASSNARLQFELDTISASQSVEQNLQTLVTSGAGAKVMLPPPRLLVTCPNNDQSSQCKVAIQH